MRLGITGHRGLPGASERLVRAALDAEVRQLPARVLIGISCIADGPDAWFAETVLDHGGRLEVVVPAANYRENLPPWHHPAYDDLMKRASKVHSTGLTESESQSHMAGSEILVRLADRLLAVWDGKPARGYGGTADVVTYAEHNDVPVRVIWPAGASRD